MLIIRSACTKLQKPPSPVKAHIGARYGNADELIKRFKVAPLLVLRSWWEKRRWEESRAILFWEVGKRRREATATASLPLRCKCSPPCVRLLFLLFQQRMSAWPMGRRTLLARIFETSIWLPDLNTLFQMRHVWSSLLLPDLLFLLLLWFIWTFALNLCVFFNFSCFNCWNFYYFDSKNDLSIFWVRKLKWSWDIWRDFCALLWKMLFKCKYFGRKNLETSIPLFFIWNFVFSLDFGLFHHCTLERKLR